MVSYLLTVNTKMCLYFFGTKTMTDGNDLRTFAIDVYLQKVRKWVTAKGFTPHGLARSCGLGPGTLAKMFTPDWNPRVDTLRVLEDFMMDYDEANQNKSQV